jgi:hypothetical protein
MGWDWVHLALRPLFGLSYQPQTIEDDCEAIGGMRIGMGSRSTRRKPVPVPLCPPQIPHDLTRARTRASAVGSRRLTVWAIAWPEVINLVRIARCLKRVEFLASLLSSLRDGLSSYWHTFYFTLHVSGCDHNQCKKPFEQQIPKCRLFPERVCSPRSTITCANLIRMA